MPYLLLVLMLGSGVTFLLSVFRAMRFAQRHTEQLEGAIQRSSWRIRLFIRNGYGEELETERKRLARAWLIAAICFFASAAFLMLTAPPPEG